MVCEVVVTVVVCVAVVWSIVSDVVCVVDVSVVVETSSLVADELSEVVKSSETVVESVIFEVSLEVVESNPHPKVRKIVNKAIANLNKFFMHNPHSFFIILHSITVWIQNQIYENIKNY